MIQIVNRTGKFMKQLTDNERAALEAVGEFCKGKMDQYARVKTGYMKSRNEYVVAQNELFLQNDCKYAGFNEFGTEKMAAQPFMRPAAYNHTGEIKRIVAEKLGSGI